MPRLDIEAELANRWATGLFASVLVRLLTIGDCVTLKPFNRAPEFTPTFAQNPNCKQVVERQPGNGPKVLDWWLKSIAAAKFLAGILPSVTGR